MTTPVCEDGGLLQEWAPELSLLSQIPHRAQRGLFSHDLKLTCVDVCPQFIALGTNCGLVYWYCRQTTELQRLRIENTNCSVVCVKIVSSVDYMVAAGTDSANVTVFQIPKQPPDSLPAAFKPKPRQVERFTIDGLHRGCVTCLEWSQNGMKLFSGDKSGIVVLTSIDFNMHLSKSSELLDEQFEIVQLSYLNSQLLISTTYRTIICDGQKNWKVTQLGLKERKILGKFGATFCKAERDVLIYATRPGQRLWKADCSANVMQTLIFKPAIKAAHPKIAILNPTREHSIEQNFGKLVQFGDSLLICYNSEVLHVLHPGVITVLASLVNVRKIIDVAVNNEEIFVLEGDRSLIRIGHEPNLMAMGELEDSTSKRKSFNFDDLANKLKETAVGSLKRIASDLTAPAEKISPPTMGDEALNLPPCEASENENTILPEEVEIHESADQVPVRILPLAFSKIASSSKTSEPEEEVIARPGKRRKPKRIINQTSQPAAGRSSESDSMSIGTGSEELLVCGVSNDQCISEDSPTYSQSSFSILADHVLMPQLANRSPGDKSQASIDTCHSASEHQLTPNLFKEEQEKTFSRLANQEMSMIDSFNSERTENMSISVNLTPSSSASSKLSEHSGMSENVSMISECDGPGVSEEQVEPERRERESSSNSQTASTSTLPVSRIWNKEFILSQMLGLDLNDPLNKGKKKEQTLQPENQSSCPNNKFTNDEVTPPSPPLPPLPVAESSELEENTSLLPESEQQLARDGANHVERIAESVPESVASKLASLDGLGYGPPSGSSMLSSCHPSLDLNSGPAMLSNPQALVVEKSDRWLQYKMPDGVTCLSICDNYVMCTDGHEHVYYSRLSGISLSWVPLDYKASSAAVSPDGSVVWVQRKKGILALVRPSASGPFSDEMVEAATNVISFSVDNDCAYFVEGSGKLMMQRNLSRYPCGKSEQVSCAYLIRDVSCRNGVVLALTADDILLQKKPDGEFRRVNTLTRTVQSMAMGPLNLIWVVDPDNNLYFTDNADAVTPSWWQVLISEYIFQNSPSTFLSMHNRVKMGAKWDMGRRSEAKQTLVVANHRSVWVYNKFSSSVHVNKLNFTGIIWQIIEMRAIIKFALLCANGAFEEKGPIWLLSVQGDLFCSSSNSANNLMAVSGPSESDVVCLAAVQDTMWVLTADGTVHTRLGLSDICLAGSGWRQLRFPQLMDERLVWISCGCDVAWCVDKAGQVFITLVPPHDMATNVFDAAWIIVDGKPKDGACFVKVFVGPHMHMVWAVDNKKQIYVREGIFPHYQIGTGWVHVGGVEANNLTVSSLAVWAVSPTGAIYRRHGISEYNYIGDYWRRVPGNVATASVTYCDNLWALNHNGNVNQMLTRHVVLNTDEERRTVSLGEADDWLVVE